MDLIVIGDMAHTNICLRTVSLPFRLSLRSLIPYFGKGLLTKGDQLGHQPLQCCLLNDCALSYFQLLPVPTNHKDIDQLTYPEYD